MYWHSRVLISASLKHQTASSYSGILCKWFPTFVLFTCEGNWTVLMYEKGLQFTRNWWKVPIHTTLWLLFDGSLRWMRWRSRKGIQRLRVKWRHNEMLFKVLYQEIGPTVRQSQTDKMILFEQSHFYSCILWKVFWSR